VGASEKERFIPASDRGKVDIGLASFLSTLDHSVTLAHPQFLKKSPSKIRSLERRGDLMGFRVEKFGSSS